MATKRVKEPKMPRTNKLVITLNDKEKACIESYCQKNRQSKGRFCRELIIRHILKEMNLYSPTLFD